MKANELMIGDWVEFPHGKDTIQEITYVRGRGYCISFAASATLFRYPIADVEPIPLTTEILQANGFDCSDEEVVIYNFTDGDYQGHFSLRRMYSGNTPKGWSFFAFNVLTIIDYVHELQHALRLCGIEKEIEL